MNEIVDSAELRAYDEPLHQHAGMRVTLDLDHVVKVNYEKFGDVRADVKSVTRRAGND